MTPSSLSEINPGHAGSKSSSLGDQPGIRWAIPSLGALSHHHGRVFDGGGFVYEYENGIASSSQSSLAPRVTGGPLWRSPRPRKPL
jgi:hypothetical protein